MEVSYEETDLERDLAELEAAGLQLSWLARRRLEQELAAFGLTLPQYMALRCMATRTQGCSMSELAENSYQVAPTMTGIVDRLVESGLAQRERHPTDRRTLRVVLTAQGEALLEQVGRRIRDWMGQFFRLLPPEERRKILESVQRYLALLENTNNG